MNRIFAAVTVAVALSSCSRTPPPSVLFITFDTTRYDHIGANGDPEAKTPTVDALAAQGLRFERAYASVSLTLPSHTTMMTGLEPIEHGVHNNGKFVVPEELDTLAERLRANGYETAAFVSAFVLDSRFRLDQGFDVYDDDVHQRTGGLVTGVASRPANEVADAAIEWLAGKSDGKPFFLWTHYYDPHLPLNPPPPYDQMPSKYAAEIAFADAETARVLEKARAAAGKRGLLVVFTSDHGESHGEHEEETHGIVAYDSTLHVPLILAGAGVPSGKRSALPSKHADLLPTILTRLGLPVPEGRAGRDLLAVWQRSSDDDAVAYFESRGPHFDLGWSVLEGIRTSRWKYTVAPEPRELYDVQADPRETVNLLDAEPEAAREMQERWLRFTESLSSSPKARVQESSLEAAEQLAALGYVQAPQEFDPSDIPDPRRFVRIHGWVDLARMAAQRGAFAEAIDTLETLKESRSIKALVLRTLAPIYAEVGRTDDGVRAYEEYIRLTGAEEAKLGLVRLLLNARRNEDALRAIDRVESNAPIVAMYRSYALARLDRLDEAKQAAKIGQGPRARKGQARLWSQVVLDIAPLATGEAELRELVDEHPEDPVLRSRLGYYLAIWGRKDQAKEALALLRAGAEESPGDAEAISSLGWGAYTIGGEDALALESLKKALELDPSRNLDRFRLAYVLRRTGDREAARMNLRYVLRVQPAASWTAKARELLAEVEAEIARAPKAEDGVKSAPPRG